MSGLDNPAAPDPGAGENPPVPPPGPGPVGSPGEPAPHAFSQPAYPSGPQPYSTSYPYSAGEAGPGLPLAALVLGLVSVVLSWVPLFDFALGVLAIILGAAGISNADRRGGAGKGMAIAGLVLGLLAVAIAIVFWVFIYGKLNSCYGTGC